MKAFLTILLSELIILPAAALCFFPMKNQLRYSPLRIVLHVFLLFFPVAPLMSWITYHFSLNPNTVLLPMLAVFYVCYHRSLTVSPDRSFAIFAYVCALMALIGNFANGFDALCNPLSGANNFSLENSVFSLILSMTVTALLFYPVTKYGSILIDKLLLSRVWYTTVLISVLFFSINFLIRPQKYQTLYTNKVFLAFWGSLAIGNLLENAIAACGDVPEEKRFINLYIETPEKNEYLYITMSNSFIWKGADGKGTVSLHPPQREWHRAFVHCFHSRE